MLLFAAIAYENSEIEEQRLEEQLFARIGQGDKSAFCQLYEETSNVVFAYALSFLRNKEDAEDVMQETFLHIRSAAHLYQPLGKPMAWILTIAKNVCLMKFRQNRHVTSMAYEEVPEELDCSQIQEKEDRLVLETAFRVLSKEKCQIIVLHAVSGMKHREISQIMGIPLSTILSKYHRGIQKLREQLEEERK